MHTSKYYKNLNLDTLHRLANTRWSKKSEAISKVLLFKASQGVSADYVLVFHIDADSPSIESFREWHTSESCTHMRDELADVYWERPDSSLDVRTQWICFVEPTGSSPPEEFVIPESAVVLFDRNSTVDLSAGEGVSGITSMELSVEVITFHPKKKKGHRFNVMLGGESDKFFRKGWKIIDILSAHYGQKVEYSVVYGLYTGDEPPEEGDSLASTAERHNININDLIRELIISTPFDGEGEEVNKGFSTTERALKKIDKKTIDQILDAIRERADAMQALDGGAVVAEVGGKRYTDKLELREEKEVLEDFLKKNARPTVDEHGEPCFKEKYEGKSDLSKKKDTIKKALKKVKEEAERGSPYLHKYLEDHLEIGKDHLRLK